MTVRSAVPIPHLDRWTEHVTTCLAAGEFRNPYLVAIDGLALVSSRTIPFADHEVRCDAGRVISCSCWAWKRLRCCVHAAEVALWLLRSDLSSTGREAALAELDAAGPASLARTICRNYLDLSDTHVAVETRPEGWTEDDHVPTATTGDDAAAEEELRAFRAGSEWGTRNPRPERVSHEVKLV